MSEVEKYNPSKIMENVTDKIKATFAELIPDEEWKRLVQKQVETFMDRQNDQWGNKKDAEFTVMCQTILKETARDHIKEYITEHFKQKFDENNKLIEDAVKDMVVNNSAEMFASIMYQSTNNAIAALRNSLNYNS